MNFEMRHEDIFSHVGEADARFVQCLSSDYAAGKGIALGFNKYFDIKNKLHNSVRGNKKHWVGKGYMVKLIGSPVFNLITKQYYYHKPTYDTLVQALEDMKSYLLKEMTEEELKKLTFYMPMIGCGLDKLEWERVCIIIHGVFEFVPINIVVCYL